MIRLAQSRKLQGLLAGAVATTQPDVVVCFRDVKRKIQADFVAQTKVTTTSGASAVDICDAPDPAVVREVDTITITNNDTASVSATVRYNDGVSTYKIITVTLLTLENLCYAAGLGWRVVDASGNVKQ